MILLGNILLVLAALLVVSAARLQLSAMPSGDSGVGFAWGVLITSGGLVLVLLATTLVVGLTNRLPTLPFAGTPRTAVAALFVAVALIASAMMLVAAPSGAPRLWSPDMLLRLAPLLVPVGIMVSAAMLLNRLPAGGATSPIVSASMGIVALCTVAFAVVGAIPLVNSKVQSSVAMASRAAGSMDENQQRILADVEAADSINGLMTFVQFARAGQHDAIRKRAIERMQAVPDWEARIREEVAGFSSTEIIEFLAANDVPNPELMATALPKGIAQQGKLTREHIRAASHPSHLYDGMQIFEVEATLKAVNKYQKYNVDYAPAMREFRAGFDEATPYDKPKFRGAQALDKWLAKHK